MKKTFVLSLLLVVPMLMAHVEEPMTRYSAVFVKGNLVINELGQSRYSRQLSQTTKGDLTVQALAFSDQNVQVLDKLPFRVNIWHRETRKTEPFSDQTYEQVPVEDILRECQVGDRIMLTLTDKRYTLIENELVVVKDTPPFDWLRWMIRKNPAEGDGC